MAGLAIFRPNSVEKCVLNLLNEPQHLVQMKITKLLKIPNKGVTNLHERKLKTNKLKLREKN